jgi:hypothetical protein
MCSGWVEGWGLGRWGFRVACAPLALTDGLLSMVSTDAELKFREHTLHFLFERHIYDNGMFS